MPSLGERCQAAKRAVTAKQLAVRLRSRLVGWRPTSPSRTTGKIAYVHDCAWCGGEANLFDKDNGQVGLGCQGTGVDGKKCRHDPVDLVVKLYAVHLLRACALMVEWGRLEDADQGEPVPKTQNARDPPSPADPPDPKQSAPKIVEGESMFIGTRIGLGVLDRLPGSLNAARGVLHAALSKEEWEVVQRDLTKDGTIATSSTVAVRFPAAYKSLLLHMPRGVKGHLYHRGELTASHLAFLEGAAKKGCSFEPYDLAQYSASNGEFEEDEETGTDAGDTDETEEEPDTARDRPSDEVAPELKVLTTTPEPPPLPAEKTPEPPPRPPTRTPDPPPRSAATARTTPVEQGRSARRDPVVAYAAYAAAVGPLAEALLRELLANGPVAGREVVLAARDRGISRGQVHAARDALGVVSLSPTAEWCLPTR